MSQLQKTRRLAQAFKQLEAIERRHAEARAAFDAAFFPWAGGRSIDRRKAREQLVSTGYLDGASRCPLTGSALSTRDAFEAECG